MPFQVRYTTQNIDWQQVSAVLAQVGMAHYSADTHQKAFENSHTVVFVWDGDCLVGFGRAISDGAYQAAIYDVAVVPSYQGQGIGKLIVEKILERLPSCNVLLYASPGKEDFYRKLGFSKMNTGMALFQNAEGMRRKGFTE